MIIFLNPKHRSNFGKIHFYEILYKDIDNLIIGWTILYVKNMIMNELFDEVYVELNVFHMLMLN